jgi:hypothetical protein
VEKEVGVCVVVGANVQEEVDWIGWMESRRRDRWCVGIGGSVVVLVLAAIGNREIRGLIVFGRKKTRWFW